MRAAFSLAGSCAALALGAVLFAHFAKLGGAATLALGGACALAIAALITRTQKREARALQKALATLTGHADETATRAHENERAREPSARDFAELPATLVRGFTDTARLLRAREGRAAAEQARLLAILDGMVEGVLVLDTDGRTRLANRALRRLFNVWGAAAGKSALELLRRADVDEALARAARSDAPVQRVVRIAAEPARVLEMHAVRFPRAGAAAGTLAVFHDVSELHRLERVRRDFVANVSHELRTPLTAIRGFTETLLADAALEGAQRRPLEIIQRHSVRLGALIEDLLELSRIEAERRALETQPVALAALTHALLRDLRPRLQAGRFTHEVAIADDLRVRADPRALERVLGNLLDNALRYTPAGGALRVAARAEGTRVRIEVADTGIGLAGADRARLFERFYRADAARGLAPGGSGLGLAMVKHWVQAMGGEVSAHDAPEQGARFCVVLAQA